LAIFQMMMFCGAPDLSGENIEARDKLLIKVKGIRSAADAYRIKLALSRLEGIEKVKFIIEGQRFRGCCTVSEDYNRYLRNLPSVPMAVFTTGAPAPKILDFLNQNFKEFSFELIK